MARPSATSGRRRAASASSTSSTPRSFGAAEPQADVEILSLGNLLLQQLGIADGVTLELNTLGDPETREAWRGALVDYFQSHRGDLSDDSKDTAGAQSAARSLDSKDARTAPICADAPSVDDFLTSEAADFSCRRDVRPRRRGRGVGRATRGWCAGSITTDTPHSSS
jgi:hypothetical protein